MNYMVNILKALPSTFRFPVLAIISAVGGFFIFGWQMEIITIWISHGINHFEFPFYLEKIFGFQNGINIWWARDFWYAFLAVCILLFGWGAYQIGARNGLNLFKNKVRI